MSGLAGAGGLAGGQGGAPAYTDAQAVAAQVAWANYQFETKAVIETNTTAVFASYHAWTPPLPIEAGRYILALEALTGGPLVAAGTDYEAQFILTLDGIGPQPAVAGPLQEYGLAAGRFPVGFALPFDLPAGSHTFDFQFMQPGGPGSAQMTQSTWALHRIG